MAETIDDKVMEAPKKQEEKSPQIPSRWETGWREVKQGAYDAANTAIAAGANAVSALKYGLDKLLLTSSFPVGAALHAYSRKDGKGNFTLATARDESLAGLAFTALTVPSVAATMQVPQAFGLEGMVTNLYSLPLDALAVAGATFFVLNPALNLLYYPIQHLIRQKTFKGMWTNLKNEYVPSLKRTWWLNAITSAVMGTVYANPAWTLALFPYFAVSAIAYRVFMSPEPIDYKKLGKALLYPIYAPLSWAQGAGSLIYNKVSKGLGQAGYAIGSSMHQLMEKLFAPAKPAAQTAPAGAH